MVHRRPRAWATALNFLRGFATQCIRTNKWRSGAEKVKLISTTDPMTQLYDEGITKRPHGDSRLCVGTGRKRCQAAVDSNSGIAWPELCVSILHFSRRARAFL
jgi:hypothetical protein